MGCPNPEAASENGAPLLSEALLFTTMCIVGLPVEVQVKDGSIYSGIFHTACVEKDYGIVLKKARMTRKGKNGAHVEGGSLIDTLVVLSGDLVQIIAKGVLLPVDGVVGNATGDIDDGEALMGFVQPRQSLLQAERQAKTMKNDIPASERSLDQSEANNSVSSLSNIEGGFLRKGEKGLDKNQVEISNGKSLDKTGCENASIGGRDKTMLQEVACSNLSKTMFYDEAIACMSEQKSVDGQPIETLSKISYIGETCVTPGHSHVTPDATDSDIRNFTDSPPPDALTSNVSPSSTSFMDVSSSSCTNPLTSSNGVVSSVCYPNTKEFKLNPGAKTFLPSFANSRPMPPTVSTTGSIGYVPSSFPVGHVAMTQPGTEVGPFAHRTSPPLKFVQNSNVVAGNSGNGPQCTLPIVGYMGSRQQPVRYGAHYPAGPAYVYPSYPHSQTAMLGRSGQLVYVHPISHDATQGAPTLSPGLSCPLLATPHQAHLPKNQGTLPLQFCSTPSFIAAGQQPLVMPAHIPLPQPIPAIRPVSVMPAVANVLGGAGLSLLV